MNGKKKEQLARIDSWVKQFNPKAKIEAGDVRIGNRYAVVTEDEGKRPTYWTQFLPLDTLVEVVRMLLNYNSFIKIKEA